RDGMVEAFGPRAEIFAKLSPAAAPGTSHTRMPMATSLERHGDGSPHAVSAPARAQIAAEQRPA
ncbi:MAG TPA: hypothetical protein VET85_11385, partial [Stellaceae bacterium]|nr:hypothetical protein [Stellaceae bacterium]